MIDKKKGILLVFFVFLQVMTGDSLFLFEIKHTIEAKAWNHETSVFKTADLKSSLKFWIGETTKPRVFFVFFQVMREISPFLSEPKHIVKAMKHEMTL